MSTLAKQIEKRTGINPFDAAKFHADSRERVSQLASTGKAYVALSESLAALNVDVNSAKRPRIVEYYGVRVAG